MMHIDRTSPTLPQARQMRTAHHRVHHRAATVGTTEPQMDQRNVAHTLFHDPGEIDHSDPAAGMAHGHHPKLDAQRGTGGR
jgi:hypothetical protein